MEGSYVNSLQATRLEKIGRSQQNRIDLDPKEFAINKESIEKLILPQL
jgi:hypothetical protein